MTEMCDSSHPPLSQGGNEELPLAAGRGVPSEEAVEETKKKQGKTKGSKEKGAGVNRAAPSVTKAAKDSKPAAGKKDSARKAGGNLKKGNGKPKSKTLE